MDELVVTSMTLETSMSLSHFKKACQVLRCVSLASKRALDRYLSIMTFAK